MSYILEALKRSQQERELGQVPTLDGTLLPTEGQSARPAPWGIAAVTLAALAFLVALYAAMRGQPSAPPLRFQSPADASIAQTPAKGEASPASAPKQDVGAATSELQAGAKPAVAPPPADLAAPKAESAPPSPVPAAPATRASGLDSLVPQPPVPPVPADIRADIEAFKNKLLQGRGGGRPAESSRPAAPAKQVKPESLRLPPDVKDRLPPFFMTVHVYDKDPAKRFVAINSVETHEGERTREGITVEKILPDGAVLSFDGHEFFRHR
jgi:general secretion pathway protein B